MFRHQSSQQVESPVVEPSRRFYVGQRVTQILGGHLLTLLRREQRQLRNAPVAPSLLRAEQTLDPLLLQDIAEGTPRRFSLVGRERGRMLLPVVAAELPPFDQPVRFLRKVG